MECSILISHFPTNQAHAALKNVKGVRSRVRIQQNGQMVLTASVSQFPSTCHNFGGDQENQALVAPKPSGVQISDQPVAALYAHDLLGLHTILCYSKLRDHGFGSPLCVLDPSGHGTRLFSTALMRHACLTKNSISDSTEVSVLRRCRNFSYCLVTTTNTQSCAQIFGLFYGRMSWFQDGKFLNDLFYGKIKSMNKKNNAKPTENTISWDP